MELLHNWENDFDLMTYSRSKPLNFASMSQLEKLYEDWLKDERELHFTVELRDSNEVVGIARLERREWSNVRSADVGTYIGKKELWGKGLGKEITLALLEMAFFQLNMDRCDAWSVEYNRRAHKVLEACGFKRSGSARQSHYVHGRKYDDYHFDVIREEYLQTRSELLGQVLGDRLEEYLKTITIKDL